MEIELRVPAGAGALQALEAGADAVSVGDEGCAYRLPAPAELKRFLEAAAGCGVRPRLVTPRTAQAELPLVLRALEAAASHAPGVDLVVNDLGVLRLCPQAAPGAGVYLGRLVARSVADCPWHDLALRRESPAARSEILRHGCDHGPKLDLFRRLGVRGLEVNNAPAVAPSLSRLAGRGLEVRVHLGRRLLTAGRNCATARHLGLQPPDCAARCGEEFELEWDGLWQAPTAHDVPPGDEHRRRLWGATVIGNRVLQPGPGALGDAVAAGAAAVIVDLAAGAGEERNAVAHWREEVCSWLQTRVSASV